MKDAQPASIPFRPSEAADGPQGGDTRRQLENARRIFVNRTLRFDQIKLVGFDMDYTLLPYKKEAMESLAYRVTAQKLVDQFDYPREILDLPYDPGFVIRGLVVDKKLGNLLKMDAHGFVGRAFHGRRALSKERRRIAYRSVKIRLRSPRYHWIDTLFGLPEAVLYADIVDFLELNQGRQRIDFAQLFQDIRNAIDEAHRDDSLKSEIRANLAKYIERDPDLPYCLHKLRSSGKKLFVLTNSYWHYTSAAMSYLLDGHLAEYPNWQNYFDFTIVGAKKPSFFSEDRPFLEVNQETGELSDTPATRFSRQRVYQGGCLADFQRKVDAKGDRILYVGDHIYGDIIRSKKETQWRTALVVEELESELLTARDMQHAQEDLLELEERRAHLEHEILQCRLRTQAVEAAIDDRPGRDEAETELLLESRRTHRTRHDLLKKTLKAVIAERDKLSAEIDRVYNPAWGSVFKEGSDNSRFGAQVEKHACLYTSRCSNFLYYSPAQYFRRRRTLMAHERI